MTLAELRRLSVRQRSRIHFRLRNGMECVIDEHGIARVPALHSVPDFNLEEELAEAGEFSLEQVSSDDRKPLPISRSIAREALAEMATAPGGAAAHAEHEDE